MKRHSDEPQATGVTDSDAPKAEPAAAARRVPIAGKKQMRVVGRKQMRGLASKKTRYVTEQKPGRWKAVRQRPQAKPEAVRAAEDRLREDQQQLRRTARALAEVLERTGLGLEASPEVARSVQASENRWRNIAREYGLLDSRAVDALLGGSGTNRNRAHQLVKEGRIIGVKRGRGTLYPGFEFDHGEVRPVIAEVAAIGRRSRWTDPHLLLWLASPNGYLEGRVPARMLDEPDRILEAARQDMAERW